MTHKEKCAYTNNQNNIYRQFEFSFKVFDLFVLNLK